MACAVGLATLNALIHVPASAAEADLLSGLQVAANDVIGMVGYFGPLVEPLRSRSQALHVFERRPDADAGLLSGGRDAPSMPGGHPLRDNSVESNR